MSGADSTQNVCSQSFQSRAHCRIVVSCEISMKPYISHNHCAFFTFFYHKSVPQIFPLRSASSLLSVWAISFQELLGFFGSPCTFSLTRHTGVGTFVPRLPVLKARLHQTLRLFHHTMVATCRSVSHSMQVDVKNTCRAVFCAIPVCEAGLRGCKI